MFTQPDEFRAESQALHDLIAPLADADYDRPTRFKRWTIGEIITHLHVWNEAAGLSLTDGAAFAAYRRDFQAHRALTSMREAERARVAPLAGRALLGAWRTAFERIASDFAAADPKARVQWAGPDMSVRSSISARLMETWAHGQAIYDLLGVERMDTDRIRNIAVLGVNTFGWTFKVHEQPVPDRMPHVRLTAPSGAVWTWNEASETDLIEGSATEFCQVVTQVRNVADTRLRVLGDVAQGWMRIAQCFAGAGETPPPPGTRFRESVSP